MHKAIVSKITAVHEIPNATNIQVAIVLGESVIVSKTVKIEDIGIFFPTELQLSEQFCHENNLFRHAALNKDTTKTGYFDDNRKVRAQTLLKVRSEGLFMPIESVLYAFDGNNDTQSWPVGKEFDELNGKPICCKYISKATREAIDRAKKSGKKLTKKAETPFFEKHSDTAQFRHNVGMISKGALLSFQSKRHGTSGRSGITKVFRDLPTWKKLINKVAPMFPEWSWQHVVATRNVLLSDGSKEGYHGNEGFRFEVAEQIRPFLSNGMTAYYEIFGTVNGKPIMPLHDMKAFKNKEYTKKYGDKIKYSYGCKDHEFKYHIYRVTTLTEDGKNIDFTQAQLEQWCDDRNLPRTLEVAPSEIYDGDVERLVAKVEALTERPEVLTEDFTDPTHISEGIIIRIDSGKLNPSFQKSKSFAFKTCEGLCEVADPEDIAAS